MTKEKDNKKKRVTVKDIIVNGLLYVFLLICVLAVALTFFSKKDADGAAEIFGYQMRIVTSESMEACESTDVSAYEIKDIPVRSMIFVETIPEDAAARDDWYRSLKVGDVLTFRYVYTTQVTITHRIVEPVEEVESGFIIRLSGDNKSSNGDTLDQVIDTSIPNNTNYVLGKVVSQSYIFGLFMSLLMQPVGIVLLIIVPCLVIILLEVLKIARMFANNKNKEERAELEKREQELEELRKRLAELEAKNAPAEESAEQTESEEGEAE